MTEKKGGWFAAGSSIVVLDEGLDILTEFRSCASGMVGLLVSLCEGAVVVLEAGLSEGEDDYIFDCSGGSSLCWLGG